MPEWIIKAGEHTLRLGGRTLVMGILNMTPDSFSGDGLAANVDGALRQAAQFLEDGADLLDIGGESTRPGHEPISAEEEMRRILPAIEAVSSMIPLPLSVDTSKAEVARRALEHGAHLINDIWGFKWDPAMAALAAENGTPVILMHNREEASYDDLIGEVLSSLEESMKIGESAGLPREKMILDPGIGFGKNLMHNLQVLRELERFRSLGRPLLVGPSRKSFIGKVLDLPVDERLEGTAAAVAWAVSHGADVVRVHDVREMVRVVRMTEALMKAEAAGVC